MGDRLLIRRGGVNKRPNLRNEDVDAGVSDWQ